MKPSEKFASVGVLTTSFCPVLAMIGPEVVSSERVAKRLARLLLADPLGAPAAWENQLEEVTDSEGRSIIIR